MPCVHMKLEMEKPSIMVETRKTNKIRLLNGVGKAVEDVFITN